MVSVDESETAGRRSLSGDRPRPSIAQALLDSAQRLFAERGYEATSVLDITRDAHTSVGTLYYHFGGKAEIFLQVYRDYTSRQGERVRQALHMVHQAGVTDGRRLFLVGMRAYLTGAHADRAISRALGDSDAPSGFTSTSRTYQQEWEARNARLLDLRPASVEGRCLLAAVNGAVGGWTRALAGIESAADAERYIDDAIRLTARMIGLDD